MELEDLESFWVHTCDFVNNSLCNGYSFENSMSYDSKFGSSLLFRHMVNASLMTQEPNGTPQENLIPSPNHVASLTYVIWDFLFVEAV